MNEPQDFGEEPFSGDSSGPTREEGAEERNMEEREVHVAGVFEHSDQSSGAMANPFVLVRDNQNRCVMIWVGKFEAFSISMALEGTRPERPMTHDLLRIMIERLGARIDRIVVDDLWDNTFYAKIWLTVNGAVTPVDSRPSDAIALAVRAGCPMYMTEAVLEESGRPAEEFEAE